MLDLLYFIINCILLYARSFMQRDTDDNDTENDVEVQGYPAMDKKRPRMDAVVSFFYEYRLVRSFSYRVGFQKVSVSRNRGSERT